MPDTKDYEQLARKLLLSAQKGDAKSQYHLGILYNDGKGVEKDYGQAASWYLKAAQQGHQKAQLYLGLLYQYGRGVQRDYRQAAQWFMKSAEQGEQKAQYFLGVLYYKGIGVAQDLEHAAHWLEQSANQGNSEAKKLLDEILSISDPEPEEIYPYDESLDKFDDTEQKITSRSRFGIILMAVAGVVILTISIGLGYYYLFGPKLSAEKNLPAINRELSAEVQSGNGGKSSIDVFQLASSGSPKQLKDAVSRGAIFNVSRSIDDDDDGDINERLFAHGETPLHYAASYNKNPESIRFLISQGLDVNAEASTGSMANGTPLSCAVSNGNLEAVRELLKAGANPHSYSSEGNMIQIAAFSKSKNYPQTKSIIEALIKSGADINACRDTERKKNILLPVSQWTSTEPLENILDDAHDDDVRIFLESCPAITCAVLNDNPELVKFLLDLKADPNISNLEGKIALYYAGDMPKLKKSDAFRKLQAATEKSIMQSVTSAKNYESAKYLNDLLNGKRVPDYIRNKGVFFCDTEILQSGGIVQVKGTNVNMRSQPNTQARIVARLDKNKPSDFPSYVGEWTDPKGDRWILAEYFDDTTNDIETAWIFGKYTGIITGEELAFVLDGIAEAEEEAAEEESSIAQHRHERAKRSTTQRSTRPESTPASKKFQSHKWMCEFCGSEVKSSSMPKPGNSCSQNPNGRFHSWIDATSDGKRHKWQCAFCGKGVDAGSMPKPGNSCSKNPYGRKFHQWLQTR